MHRRASGIIPAVLLAASALTSGCGRGATSEPLLAAETFTWVRQPIAFSSPPSPWQREGDGGAGTIGVRHVLRGGGGQCISVAAFSRLAERDRREALEKLRARRDSLSQREFLRELSLARWRSEQPISEREAAAARAIDRQLDLASEDYRAGRMAFVEADLDAAIREASQYQMTLAELWSQVRLRPERQQHPEWWRAGIERDTVVAGLPAYAIDDTLITPDDQRLLFQEVFWVVNGYGFKATFQGMEENLPMFRRVVDSIQFPEPAVASR